MSHQWQCTKCQREYERGRRERALELAHHFRDAAERLRTQANNLDDADRQLARQWRLRADAFDDSAAECRRRANEG